VKEKVLTSTYNIEPVINYIDKELATVDLICLDHYLNYSK